ncbi:preprotein translocase subunit YajC [Aerococcus urinaeequi]|uniref:Preprotein translocase subunit YajC n=1 Tax=Aerococcus urinaeequi TaxID=51665 RepID=A0A7M1KQZ1_9LACT|nr:preprotein translocase subunit YajC [Aerococcus urinaeequi]KAF3300732.1 preprotein translocase subunit YajC [Carnobacterium sp. PL17RED31]QOQ78564.1 preprotein translocase subunit YajC [Aerococcus urinaeequi]WCG37136.1 preprotein translocase subunit YajC [Aerococcus urinaeequi]
MGIGTILYIVVLVALMYFMLIRPQQKRQKETQEMMAAMAVGDSAVTIGGLHGVIAEIDETKNTITLDCEGVYLVFDRRAIARTQKADPMNTEMANDIMSDAAEEEARENDVVIEDVEAGDQQEDDQI